MSVDTPQRILLATIACVERSGIDGVRTRDIAAEAGVNLAAVNYHFGSKQAVIDKAIALTVTNGIEDVLEVMEGDAAGPDATLLERIELLLARLIANMQRYPQLSRAHMHGLLRDGRVEEPMMLALIEMQHRVAEGVPEASRAEFLDAFNAALAATFLIALAPRWHHQAGGEDPTTPLGVARIAQRLMRLFPELERGR